MKSSVVTAILIFIFTSPAVVMATELVDILLKPFKSIEYPYKESVVQVKVLTEIHYLQGNNRGDDIQHATRMHEKVIHVMGQNGWKQNDGSLFDIVDGGKIELVLGEGMSLKFKKTLRLKLFLHMCDSPLRKYRGGDLNEYLNKSIEDAEYCLTYENRLQGKNYPY